MNSLRKALNHGSIFHLKIFFTSQGLFVGPVGSVVEVIEVPTLTSPCNLPRFPTNDTLPVLLKQDLGITLCGGYFTANCWVLIPSGWIESQAMSEIRTSAASVQLGDSWWVSGKIC